MEKFKFLLVAAAVGAAAGAVTTAHLQGAAPTADERIADFYATETAVLVSPHGLRKAMDRGSQDFVLVDVRSQEEYEREHVVGALNVPAYKDPETSAYGDVERIVAGFREIEAAHPDRDIVVYCYSIPCMTGRKVGKMLADHGVYVKELGVGWNEWRYAWTSWNHEHEWDVTRPEDYVVSGAAPGTPTVKPTAEGCKIDNEFGC